MAKRNTGRHGRSRKRRPAAQGAEQRALAEQPPATSSSPAKSARRARASASLYKDPLSVGERPRAPWHPLPVSELLILLGGIGTIVAFKQDGLQNGGTALFASLAAVALGTIEVTLREHLSGYRSHTLILALLPTIVFHSAVVLILAAFVRVPRWLTPAMLAIDAALFAFLFKLLRLRFLDARRERTFTGRR